MKIFAADLHVHSALSPCASVEMTPPAIVREAISLGLDIIAVCDHNGAGNAKAVQQAAGRNLAVIAGIEITTMEEVHVLGLFPDAKAAEAAASEVLGTLPGGVTEDGMFGGQHLMDASGNKIGRELKMLASASSFDLNGAVALIKKHHGVAVAAHVDRPSFSVISQLGLFPDNADFDAIEISRAGVLKSRADEFSSLGLPTISSSDAHFISDIGGSFTYFEMDEPTFDKLKLTLKGAPYRECWIG